MPDEPVPTDEDDTRPGPDPDWDEGDEAAAPEPEERPDVPPADLGDPDDEAPGDVGDEPAETSEYPPPATAPGEVDLGEPVG